ITRYLYEQHAQADPIVIGTGLLTGTLFPATAAAVITAKSPVTGNICHCPVTQKAGLEIQFSGFDYIVIRGKSAKPVFLWIHDGVADITDAADVWGKDVWDTTAAWRKTMGDELIQTLVIGPAGENLVKFATVACNNSRVCGRTGMGCLFGSKNLKAVAVRGRGRLTLADPLEYLELCRTFDRKILQHPEYTKRKELGSTLLMKALDGIGILPTNHFQQGLADYVDQVSGERLAQEYKVKNKSCFNCPIHCSRYYITPETESEGPEFETLCSYSSRIGNRDLPFALKMAAYLNRMGLDSLSSGETIGWAMECVQRGLLNKDDFDGLDFTWGNRETIEKIVRMIVFRQGIGDAFAEGTRSLAARFGRGTEEYALQVKGLDMICGDPRGLKAFGLTYAIASRGADHLRAEPFFELTERYEESVQRFGTRDAADRLADHGKAVLVEYTERQALLTDCLTLCKNVGLSMDILDFEFAARLLRAGTGLTFTPEKMDQALRGIIDADRRMNIAFGVTADQDTLPKRFTHEPLTEGPSKGTVVPVKQMVQEYYGLRGWDETGKPK
ncbi:MAG: aldehyde:ferredoxin oxidoreductase, partial [Desulfobacteraceae bacterium]